MMATPTKRLRLEDDEKKEEAELVLDGDPAATLTHITTKKHKIDHEAKTTTETQDVDSIPTAVTPTKRHEPLSVDQKAILAVLASVQSHPNDLNIVKDSIGYLTSLLHHDNDNLLFLMKVNGIELLTSAMKPHMDDAELQDKGGDLISILCELVETMPGVTQIDGIWAVIHAMKNLQAFEVILEECCRALISFTYKDASNEEIVAMADGIDPILATMKIHLIAPDLLASCCMVLMNMTCSSDANKAKIAEAGGIETILDAMKAHRNCETVQGEALGALENLLDLDENVQTFVDVQGILITATAMKSHPRDCEVQKNGCGVFWKISACRDDEYIMRIVEAGGIGLSVVAMALHAKNKDLQLRACHFFSNLIINQEEISKDAIIEAGGLEVIGAAIRMHRKDDEETFNTALQAMVKLIET